MMRSRAADSSLSRRATIITLAPASASSRATWPPMPAEPPVISATLPRCSPVMFSDVPTIALARAGGFADAFGQIEVDRLDAAFLEHDARRLAGGKRQAFGFGIGVADDLVAPFGACRGGRAAASTALSSRQMRISSSSAARSRLA